MAFPGGPILSKQRSSFRRGDHIEYGGWIVVDAGGGMRMTRQEPRVGNNERKVFVVLRVPLAVFKTPELRAELTFVGAPAENNIAQVEAAVQEVVSGFGLSVHLQPPAPTE